MGHWVTPAVLAFPTVPEHLSESLGALLPDTALVPGTCAGTGSLGSDAGL